MARAPKKKPAARRATPDAVDRPSTVDRMDPAIQAEIMRLRFTEGRHLHEIIAHLKAMGAEPPSRTALGRHLKGMSAQMKAKMDAELGLLGPAMQFANSFAEAVTAKIGEADGDNKLRATRELMQSQIFRMVVASSTAEENDPDAPRLDVKELFSLSRTLQTLAQAERTEQARILEAEAAAREDEKRKAEEARRAAMAKVEELAKGKGGGLTAETVEQIRKFVLGDA